MAPDIEVIWDSNSAVYASMNGTLYDRERHLVVEHSHWIDILRGQLNNPDLFLYLHLETAKFVLASWVFRPTENIGPGLMMELETMSGHPDHLGSIPDLPHLDYLRRRCCTASEMQDRMAHKVKRITAQKKATIEQEGLARKDYSSYLARKYPNQPDIAQSIKSGLPWSPNTKVNDEDWHKFVKRAQAL